MLYKLAKEIDQAQSALEAIQKIGDSLLEDLSCEYDTIIVDIDSQEGQKVIKKIVEETRSKKIKLDKTSIIGSIMSNENSLRLN